MIIRVCKCDWCKGSLEIQDQWVDPWSHTTLSFGVQNRNNAVGFGDSEFFSHKIAENICDDCSNIFMRKFKELIGSMERKDK